MHLVRVEISNFKGIGELQTVNLRPITLLFGPNSAGKSTILQALHYLREILERGNVDPDVTIAGGLIDLGGFATLVHNHELDRAVTLKVTIDLSDDHGVDQLPLNEGLSIGEAEFSDLQIRYLVGEGVEYRDTATVKEISVAVEVRWSELDKTPYIAQLGIDMNGEPLAAIVSPPQAGRAQLTNVNFAHPLLRRAILSGDEPDESLEALAGSPLEDEIWLLAREAAADRSTPDTPDDKLRIAVATRHGALPHVDRELALELRDPEVDKVESEERTPRVNGLRSLLSEMIVGPVRIVVDYLSQMTYIGPLRSIPNRNYRPQVSPDETRWANGLAAWDFLYNDRSDGLMTELNQWLADETLLRTGYQLERVQFKEVPVPSALHQMFERGLTEDDVAELQGLYYRLATRTEIVLRDFERGILVAPGDVGVGISQMIPVVVGALRQQHGILAIEQPELHVHPAIQVGIGDLFIRAVRKDGERLSFGKALLVETHSEHIMLRLLRRIRETSEGELPPGIGGLQPEDLSVIYVEPGDDGVRFRALAVNDEGDFRDQWPHGFFEERAGELF